MQAVRINDRVKFHTQRGFDTGIITGFKGKNSVIVLVSNGTGKPYHYIRRASQVKVIHLLYDDLAV